MSGEWRVEYSRGSCSGHHGSSSIKSKCGLPDRRLIEDFYTIAIPEFVVVTGFDRGGKVLIERKYRHETRVVTWSLPSGYVNPDEGALTAAKRELLEGTGFKAKAWESLGCFVVDANRGCGWANLFEAEGPAQVGEPDSRDLGEIEICLIPTKGVLTSLFRGGVAEPAVAAAVGIAVATRAGLGHSQTETPNR